MIPHPHHTCFIFWFPSPRLYKAILFRSFFSGGLKFSAANCRHIDVNTSTATLLIPREEAFAEQPFFSGSCCWLYSTSGLLGSFVMLSSGNFQKKSFVVMEKIRHRGKGKSATQLIHHDLRLSSWTPGAFPADCPSFLDQGQIQSCTPAHVGRGDCGAPSFSDTTHDAGEECVFIKSVTKSTLRNLYRILQKWKGANLPMKGCGIGGDTVQR